MINTKKELKFYIMADRIMNGLSARPSWKEKLTNIVLATPPIMEYIERMRKVSYYYHQSGFINKLRFYHNYHKYNKLSALLGVFIAPDVCGYGLIIPHHGTIIIGGGNNKIGNYAVIHTSTCITEGNKVIGEAFYLSTGAKVVGDITIGDGVSVSANSVVNHNCGSNALLVGAPAIVKKEAYQPWYVRDSETFINRINQIEAIKKELCL